MMTQVREGETDRPNDFVFADPSQRKKKEKAKPKWDANNKYASSRVDDWMGAPGAKAKKGYKVKAISTTVPSEDPDGKDSAPPARASVASESPSPHRWKPPQKEDAALPPWMSASAPLKTSSPKKWTPKNSTPPPPPVNRPSPSEETKDATKDPENRLEQPEMTAPKEEAKPEDGPQASKATEETPETSEDSEHEAASHSEAYGVNSDVGESAKDEPVAEESAKASDATDAHLTHAEAGIHLKLQDFSVEEIALALSVNEGGSEGEWLEKLKNSMGWAVKTRKGDN
jgi:hypothetical protein